MCTLFFRHRPEDEYPLAILSNRDEFYSRASGGWEWRGPDRSYFSPIDLEAGGTWIGLNRLGVVAALTNIFPRFEEGIYRSRGVLVTDLLLVAAAANALDAVERSVAMHSYNKFNLLIADAATAAVFVWAGRGLKTYHLPPGVYEVNNLPFNGASYPESGATNQQWLDREAARLTEHPMVCRHGDGYGTRCSHKLLLSRHLPDESMVWHLDGHPCQERFTQVLGIGER